MSKSSQIRALLIDAEMAARTAFSAISEADIDARLHPVRWPAAPVEAASGYDVIVVGVGTALGLQILADLCARPDAPPVIGMATTGFDGKSLEHVLLLAEIRGAAATMIGPAESGEIARAIRTIVALRQAPDAPERMSA